MLGNLREDLFKARQYLVRRYEKEKKMIRRLSGEEESYWIDLVTKVSDNPAYYESEDFFQEHVWDFPSAISQLRMNLFE